MLLRRRQLYGNKIKLPKDFLNNFKQVEYIANTTSSYGSSSIYIDPGLSSTEYSKGFRQIDNISVNSTSAGYEGHACFGHTTSSPFYRNGLGFVGSGGTYYFGVYDSISVSTTFSANTYYEYDCSTYYGTAYLSRNGVQLASTSTTYTNLARPLIFTNDWLRINSSYAGGFKIAFMKLYSPTTTLLRDFYPCYLTASSHTAYRGTSTVTVSSGAIGLYDVKNERFYTFQSTSGVKGADVPFKVLKSTYYNV